MSYEKIRFRFLLLIFLLFDGQTANAQTGGLFRFDYHKVEALEFVPGASGGVAFGADDENPGAAIHLDW